VRVNKDFNNLGFGQIGFVLKEYVLRGEYDHIPYINLFTHAKGYTFR
ncbi:1007_t:CDS:2, partial [Racocetra persica]